MRKLLHPILLAAMRGTITHEISILNEHPAVEGNAIYAVTHYCASDGPVTCTVIKRHVYLLVGKQRMKLLDKATLWLNGSVWADRKSKESKRRATDYSPCAGVSGRRVLRKVWQAPNRQ